MFRSGFPFLAVLLLAAAGCGKAPETRYATLAAATAAHAQEQGWLPPVLPESTIEIVERHDPGTLAGTGEFRFDPSDRMRFKDRLVPVAGQALHSLERSRVHLLNEGYQFYTVPGFQFAINWQRCTGYFWRDATAV